MLDDVMKKAWIKIMGIYIVGLLSFFLNYSFLYTNEISASIFTWIDPNYLVQFLVLGMVGCVCLCKQPIKEFSSKIFNRESLVVLLCNAVFILFVIIIGKTIGKYEINWIGVLNRSIFCYIFVALTEEWIYRGFIVTQMKKAVNSELKIVFISAVLFSLTHLPSYLMYTENITFGGIVYRLLIPFLLGVVFAHIYLCNGNLLLLILLHGSYNMIENIAFDGWYYVSYGIGWILILGYSVYCYKRKMIIEKEGA